MMRILFDASILAEGLHKTSNRSGIFVASLEIFRALDARQDVELGIYAAPTFVDAVNAFLMREFPGRNYRAFNRRRSLFWGRVHEYIAKRREDPVNGAGCRRRFWQMCALCVKVARILTDKYAPERNLAIVVGKFDAFFSPFHLAPKRVRSSGIPRYTLLYDTMPVLFPQAYPMARFGISWNIDLIRGLRPDDRCFAISECTKQDFLRFSKGLRTENVTVVPLAASEKFHLVDDQDEISRVRAKYHVPADKRYVLSLCTIEPRKNLGRALEAFGKFVEKSDAQDIVFVLAGGKWGRFEGKWAATLEKLGKTRELVVHAGYVDDEDLAALYSGAEMFVYPSLYEGFGLPPLEAMRCGTPVITSNVSSLPEVVGDAALTIDPTNLDEMSAAIKRLAEDPGLCAELREKGLSRARQFSWARAAGIIVSTMQKTI